MICFFVSIGYLASSFFGVTIFYTTPFFYIFLGLTYAEYLKNGRLAAQESGGTTSTDLKEAASDQSISNEPNCKDADVSSGSIPWESTQAVPDAGKQELPSARDAHRQGLEEGRALGRREGAGIQLISMVCKKLQKGKTPEEIAEELDEDAAKIREICDAAQETAPDYDAEMIYHAITEK